MINPDVTNCPNIVLGKDIAFIIPNWYYVLSIFLLILLSFLAGIGISIYFIKVKQWLKK